jgi:hypothetical protein
MAYIEVTFFEPIYKYIKTTQCTPDNIIKHGGFDSYLPEELPEKKIRFRFSRYIDKNTLEYTAE